LSKRSRNSSIKSSTSSLLILRRPSLSWFILQLSISDTCPFTSLKCSSMCLQPLKKKHKFGRKGNSYPNAMRSIK
jgi:hypothetical protein